ncbi:protease complex subunit PrcB family protein (plasmid) [Pontibacillus sp. ALD_SL1]|uniref:protease complex subunit PrcB family protein n=1 Tax=Pontibacillus sp. ALD_SL1 TaxID=2777185 RepID=UPI001A95A23B|nr:protease complex subunit PrcB family protein [Pontibacillus sp. ALD_SL1]QST02767.1 protease complex subunit PrcB family protein [Pontibacillus sp. ALD_SL1]
MKKRLIGLSVAASLALVLGACQEKEKETVTDEPDVTVDSEEETVKEEEASSFVSFQLDPVLSEELDASLYHISEMRGYGIVKQDEEGSYIYIGSGVKETGGHTLEVEKAELNDGHMTITVSEIEPGEDEVVTEALTYPHHMVFVEDEFESLEVVSVDGEAFEDINREESEAE